MTTGLLKRFRADERGNIAIMGAGDIDAVGFRLRDLLFEAHPEGQGRGEASRLQGVGRPG